MKQRKTAREPIGTWYTTKYWLGGYEIEAHPNHFHWREHDNTILKAMAQNTQSNQEL